MTFKIHCPKKAIGFTLMEVLIVTAIIAIISSILFSVFSNARERGRRTTCQSNLRQIAMAMQQYVDDNGGDYPLELSTVGPWQQAIFPYAKNPHIFVCPDHDADVRVSINTNSILTDPGSIDYTFNLGRLNTFLPPFPTNHVRGTHESSLATPGTIWLNMDKMWSDSIDHHFRMVSHSSCSGSFAGGIMHGDGSNYSFVDSHVKWLTPEEFGEVECANGPMPAPWH